MKYCPVRAVLAVIAALDLIVLHPLCVNAQGSLTPPGPPAPTMKSLDQIEARTPVDAINTPGNSSAQFIITRPGSYYFTANITGVAGVPLGIVIETNDVTLDLNGFAMTGLGNNVAILVSGAGSYQNLVIRNGTLRNWGEGVAAASGYCELEHLRVYGDASYGFYLGDHCTVRNCTASQNGSAGITIGNAGVVADCLICSNATGIAGGSDCIIGESQMNYNLGDGVDLVDNFNVSQCMANGNGTNGFNLANDGMVIACTACGNGVSGSGITLGDNCIVKDCIASGNVLDGIYVASSCMVKDNTCNGNGYDGLSGIGSGVRIQGGQNRLDGNIANNNALYGLIDFGSGGNWIVRNSAAGNVVGDYHLTADELAPIQTPSTATNPWANF